MPLTLTSSLLATSILSDLYNIYTPCISIIIIFEKPYLPKYFELFHIMFTIISSDLVAVAAPIFILTTWQSLPLESTKRCWPYKWIVVYVLCICESLECSNGTLLLELWLWICKYMMVKNKIGKDSYVIGSTNDRCSTIASSRNAKSIYVEDNVK